MDTESLGVMSNYQIKMNVVLAMGELMKTTPFDKLSVAKICEASSMSRATFYRYFEDKFAVPQWHLNCVYAQGANEIGRTLTWYEGHYITEALIAEQVDFYTGVSKSNDYNAIDNYAPRIRREVLRKTITDFKGLKLSERLRFEIDAAVEVECHLFPRWHYGKYDSTLEEACKWVTECIPRELFELLNTPINPRKKRNERKDSLA